MSVLAMVKVFGGSSSDVSCITVAAVANGGSTGSRINNSSSGNSSRGCSGRISDNGSNNEIEWNPLMSVVSTIIKWKHLNIHAWQKYYTFGVVYLSYIMHKYQY